MKFVVRDAKQPPAAVVTCRQRNVSDEVEVLVNGVVHLTFSTDGDIVLDNVSESRRVEGVQYEDDGKVKIWRED